MAAYIEDIANAFAKISALRKLFIEKISNPNYIPSTFDLIVLDKINELSSEQK